MKRLTSLIRSDKEFYASVEVAKEQLRAKAPKPIIINGLSTGAAVAYLVESMGELRGYNPAPVLVIVGSESERQSYAAALSSFGIKAYEYKARDFTFHNISASHDTERERLSVLSAIISGECEAVVTTPSAALAATIPESVLLANSLTLRCGEEISPSDLISRLILLGFAEVDMVDGRGQFSRRGGIIDVWADAAGEPARIEFFGDEIDRICEFDPITQRSLGTLEVLQILPAGEVIVTSEARAKMLSAIEGLISRTESEEIKTKLSYERSAVRDGLPLNFKDKYIGLIYGEFSTLFSYFTSHGKCITYVIDTNGVREDMKRGFDAVERERAAMLDIGTVTKEAARYMAAGEDFDSFLLKNVTFHLNAFSSGLGNMRASGIFGFRCRRGVSYGDNPTMLIEDLKNYKKSDYRILILCENKQAAEGLISALASADISAVPEYDNPDFNLENAARGQICVDVGEISEGYELMTPRISVLSMARDKGRAVMANRRRQRILRRVGGAGQRLMSYADLSVGDYVVHANYGIGLFEGMETVTVDGVTKDYITIKYAGTDKLFVPCDRLEFIGKYIGEKDKDGTVKLSHMGGGDWTRAKTKAKAAAKDIAKDLIRLYAERQRKPGFAFPADSELEDEFASAFEYEETESQLLAIEEIKADMMKPVPMNRLLCGDVGFGKTEVALRAAFKAIMGGKQVAILVPTTILALQHLETASTRMRGYPVSVEMLSRFRTPKQQEAILRRVKRGEVDILIGTHKILSRNTVEFKDLGLLIIDEEQRFGVAQKEKLKEMAKNVDVLTLSATPIPRTLNMAMNGISDMSILDEAPGERRPVQTYVLEHDDGVIFDAIGRELARRGQVLYLYNRVEDIDFVKGRIMSAFPDARVASAHGKMDKDELEDIWQMLVSGEVDILVCTTIIETGVDLPNANTLIIENADRMGLSQLHQIRGRVGRSARQAYAYFTYRPGKALSDIATKRLRAIREFAEFGAGFKVALRDLEIRGAGNLLGAEQHGYIDSVGYDLYVKLLNEAVLEERGEVPREEFEAAVDIKLNANIPEKYIPVSAQRMEMYKKISLISFPEDMDDVLEEFIDRFGEPPSEVMRLLRISLLRSLASKCEIKRVELKGANLSFISDRPDLAIWSELFEKHAGLSFRGTGSPVIIYRIRSGEDAVERALAVMKDYYTLFSENKAEKEEKNV